MSQTQPIVDLLQQKKSLFLQFEQESEAMCFCPVEEIDLHMCQRLRLQQDIDEIDRQLIPLYEAVPGAAQAAAHETDRTCLPGDLLAVYDAALSVKGVLNRILQNEPTLLERVRLERDGLLQKLEESRQSSSSVANGYYKSMSTGHRPFRGPTVTKA